MTKSEIVALQKTNGKDEPDLYEHLRKLSPTPVRDEAEVSRNVEVEKVNVSVPEFVPPIVVESPVVVEKAKRGRKPKAVVAPVTPKVKGTRGRKTMYEVKGMKVGDSFVYKGSLSSGRVLACLKGKEFGWRFKAVETAGNVVITRKE